MGGANLGEIMQRLAECGRAPDEPVAVVRWGTTPDQRVIAGTIADIATRVAEAGLTPPLVTVVGPVVRLRDTLRWFDNRPLFGKRVLVTRAPEQAGVLSQALAEAGAEPIELPAIEIVPRVDRKALRQALDRLDAAEYDWLVFSSANGVDIFFDQLRRHKKDARALGRARVCAIGPATAAALACHGVIADVVPERFIAEGIVEALSERDIMGKRVLWPRARGAPSRRRSSRWSGWARGRRAAAVQRRRPEAGRRRGDGATARRRGGRRDVCQPVGGAQPAEDAGRRRGRRWRSR